jgi:type II secretory pathway component PulK
MVARERGFILASVLWTLAIVLIIAGVFHSYVQRKLEVATQAKQHLQQTLDGRSTEQTLLYLLVTSRMTLAGMTLTPLDAQRQNDENFSVVAPIGDEIRLDGTIYQGIGDTLFSLQDTAGLIAFNISTPTDLEKLLTTFEPDAAIRSRLIASLQDYIDEDDLVRLGGAESSDYVAEGMEPPPNEYLRSELEFWKVKYWPEWLRAHPEFNLQEWLSIRRISFINLNAMPKSLLMNFMGLTESDATRVMAERASGPFYNDADFATRTGVSKSLDEDKYRFFPTNELRLRYWSKGGGQAQLISLQLTPNGLSGPWLVDYEYSVQTLNNDNEALAIRQSTLFKHSLDTGQ